MQAILNGDPRQETLQEIFETERSAPAHRSPCAREIGIVYCANRFNPIRLPVRSSYLI